MSDCFWRPISVDCVDPVCFPDVAVYLKRGGNYVLYKDKERGFTQDDLRRLETTFTEFLYVRSSDMEEINSYMEKNLADILASTNVSGAAKGRILYQTSVNHVINLFESPEMAANLERCRKLIRHMIEYVANEPHALEPLQSIAAHNFYIFAHSVQVAALNLLVHEKLFQISPDEMTDVGIGSLLHDFGMIFISDQILEKPDALSEVEYYKVKEHAQKGYEYLKQTGLFSDVALTIVRHHHERHDGNGYPTGIKGSVIPRSAQLSAICDVYSALTTDRPFRKASTSGEALRIMREEAKSGFFNYELFDKFEDLIVTLKGVSNQERDQLLASRPTSGRVEIILRSPDVRYLIPS
ncbi:HD-GYP domain-containing protein [Geobacter sp. SVR]|uniref:HD-GYP domain-containing protein n=1 Tax=Geobacter sp. SVR TaxID=2495594 RepID=UPI00143EFE6C|nr:HD domain-containing phosphohydrolase [Geobacter sp. SVR]BCS54436.1 cyclic di-GMP phosphodiesterase [Geobacter sp. SVR]GCF87668.1 cyclic di-GMP phosphodiesterase [Geobacter sp. SVR]